MAEKKLFFAHQSVGFDLMAGIEKLDFKREFNITENFDAGTFSKPVFAHQRIGTNRNPISKIHEFVKVLDNGIGASVDICFVKLCYVDIEPQTDLDQLLNSYQEAMEKVLKRFPELTILHCTVPITTVRPAWVPKLKSLAGKYTTDVKLNEKREIYNNKLRKLYNGKEPLFDLARWESYVNNKDSTVKINNRMIPVLHSKYTHDGGHLNSLGRQQLARQLIFSLAEII
ncbi:MAG: hypothetical protein OEZ68_00355 [Gammaproteobacteria bacterium]|nr:hypothetical protein [Gammaproteobacteria bacterium]MDH5799230.1 hypothetical protein [Gammaproteobacteria bacterium]